MSVQPSGPNKQYDQFADRRISRRLTRLQTRSDLGGPAEISSITVASDWAENSSCTGVPNIVRSGGKVRASVWTILVLAGLVATAYHMYTMFARYYQYNISVAISMMYATKLTFPAITLCNLNPVRKSTLSMGGPAIRQIFPLSEGTSNSTVDSSGRASTVLNFANLFATLPESTQTQMGHQLSDMLLDCLASGELCTSVNFTQFVNTRYGNCYTFNEDTDLITHRPGLTNGVSLELFIQQTEYIPDITESAGMILVLHDHNASPFPEDMGLLVHPGTITNIAIKQLAITRLESPYPHKCWYVGAHEVKDLSLYSEHLGFGYSIEACYKTCYQVSLVKTCSCGDAYYPLYGAALNRSTAADAVQPCTNSTQMDCELNVLTDYKAGNLNCNCSVPCKETHYDVVVSQATWPNVQYEQHLKNKLRGISGDLSSIINDNTMNMNEHILKINLFYSELNKESITEGVAYDATTLLADVGGVIGLYLGLSVVAVFEFFELIFDLGFYGSTSCNKRKPTVSGM